MDSLNVFDAKPLPKQRHTRPAWLVLVAASLLPGLGHFLLGRHREGGLLLAGTLVLPIVLVPLVIMDQAPDLWLATRAATLLYLFGIIDSTLLTGEIRDRRLQPQHARPRGIALLNLLFYGGGYWRLERRLWAGLAVAGGVLLHGVLGMQHGVFLVLGEIAAAALGYHGFALAKAEALPRRRRIGLGEMPSSVTIDRTAGWVMPTLVVVAALNVALVVSGHLLQESIEEAVTVRQDRAVVVQPFYRNPEYGVSLEMQAPGWSFGHVDRNEFVRARHVAHDASVRLSVHPRVPGLVDAELGAFQALTEAFGEGFTLHSSDGRPRALGELDGYQLEATGARGSSPRHVRVLSAVKGLRLYVLWFEWSPRYEYFAQDEWTFMLDNLELDGQQFEGVSSLARDAAGDEPTVGR